jgi:TonB-linked SusC/RagA family outer membrane protein
MKKLLQSLFILLFIAGAAMAQDRTITGTVTGKDDGMPIPGVSVKIVGTSSGTSTDASGKYALKIASGQTSIEFTSIGYMKQVITVGSSNVVNAIMETDARQLGEVVVTGVGAATDKRKVAIAVETVKDFPNVPTASIDQALVGKIAGAQISSLSGQPGQQANIVLRGINSLGTNQPMILIDGVEINAGSSQNGSESNVSSRLADLDLSNVERVEVVQGAAAATIYGAQGANGVIQIFTKRGSRLGKTKITYNTRVSLDNALMGNYTYSKKHYYATDAQGYIVDGAGDRLQRTEEGYLTFPERSYTDANTANNKNYVEPLYDHADQFFKNNVPTFNNGLNISGGKEGYDFALNVSRLNQKSIVNGDYDRSNLSLNFGVDLFKGFTVRSNTQLIYSNNSTGGITGQNNIYGGLGSALSSYPYEDLNYKDPAGNYIFNSVASDNSVYPFYTQQFRDYNAKNTRIVQSINLNYKFPKFLEIDYKYGIDNYRFDFTDFIKYQENTLTPGKGLDPFNGKLTFDRDNETFQNSLLTAFLKTDFEKDFNFSLPIQTTTQLAFDWRKRKYQNLNATGVGFAEFPPYTLSAANSKTNGDRNEEFITYGYLINQRVDYGNLFGFSGGVRIDYSSAFGRGSDAFVFPRADAYFRFDQLINSDKIYNLKLRAAYGEAGIQPGPYDRIITLASGNIGDANYLSSRLTSRNADLDVQVSKETEVGVDMGLTLSRNNWFQRINLNATYWDRTGQDVIRELDVSPSTGAASILTNALDLKSHGFQLGLDLDVLKSSTFDWTFGTRFGMQRSIVDRIQNKLPIAIGDSGSGGYVLKEGEAIGSFYGVTPVTSLDQTTTLGEPYIPVANRGDFEIGPNGWVVNKTTNSVLFATEKVKIGDANPKFNASFFNTFIFKKNLTFSFQLDWIYGADVYNQTRQWLYADKIHGDVDKEVTINGKTGAFLNYYNSLYNTNQANSTFVENGSFLRLRDISLSYNFKDMLPKLQFINSLQFTVSARNLFTISNYSGLDPEAAANINDPVQRGLDLYAFPNFRSVQFGLSVGF